jgi:hypothetical protein
LTWCVGLSVRLSLLPVFCIYHCTVCVDCWEKILQGTKNVASSTFPFHSVISYRRYTLTVDRLERIGLRTALLCVVQWSSWTRHCVTSRNVVCSVPATIWSWRRVSRYQKWETEVSPTGKGGRYVGLTTLPLSCAYYTEILRASTFWSPNWISLAFTVLRFSVWHKTFCFLKILAYSNTSSHRICITNKKLFYSKWSMSLFAV